jgi:hypothetical protein
MDVINNNKKHLEKMMKMPTVIPKYHNLSKNCLNFCRLAVHSKLPSLIEIPHIVDLVGPSLFLYYFYK